MVRIEVEKGWMLLTHPHHAALAGRFADHWGNAQFPRPEPFPKIRMGVARHDDAWSERDAQPELTREGRPSAFSRELVGTYDAFEEIDFEEYLAVRARATEAIAAEHPFSAALISMHTYNLLSEQVDRSSLSDAEQWTLDAFLEKQKARQSELFETDLKQGGSESDVDPVKRLRAFKFLQCCDSLSLTVCVRYPDPIPLRHQHPTVDGDEMEIHCYPLGGDRYRIDPYPFDEEELTFEVPYRFVPGKTFDSLQQFRDLYRKAPDETFTATLVKDEG